MKLNKLYVRAFRNFEDIVLTPAERFNVFYGDNGQGKTNMLEAIFILATLKSFKGAKNSELISWGAANSLLKGWVERNQVKTEIALLLERRAKKVKVDGKSAVKLDDVFGQLNAVLFTPEEANMVKGVPDLRRRYLDRAVFSSDVSYLTLFHAFGRILKNRNMLLRRGDTAGLDVWTEKLIDQARRVIKRRLAYLREIEQPLALYYREISGNEEEAGISYKAHRLRAESQEDNVAEGLRKALEEAAAEETRRGITLAGPHRDDVEFLLNGRPLKQFGSQGQQKSFVLALKMAEIEYHQKKFGHPPIFLLDDISSELDPHRKKNLMEFLKRKQMQVFITTTALDNISLNGIENYRTYLVSKGKILN